METGNETETALLTGMGAGGPTGSRSYHLRLDPAGRVLIPNAVRQELGLRPGDLIVMDRQARELRLKTFADLIQEMQAYFQQFKKPDESVVAEFIAERRAEAERD